MTTIPTDDPIAVELVDAIHAGDVAALQGLLYERPGLATARLGEVTDGGRTRSLLHVVADWPGHYPNGGEMVRMLAGAGADVNARFTGPHTETALHWAASSDDVDVLDALLDVGADIDTDGAVIAGDTPLMDAVAFGQWRTARRLVERGAAIDLWKAAALGLVDRVDEYLAADPPPSAHEVNSAFWAACHGGQQEAGERLLAAGADINWLPGWEKRTPLDAARRSGAYDVLRWLHGMRAQSAEKLAGC